jgi:hypothetical protein
MEEQKKQRQTYSQSKILLGCLAIGESSSNVNNWASHLRDRNNNQGLKNLNEYVHVRLQSQKILHAKRMRVKTKTRNKQRKQE